MANIIISMGTVCVVFLARPSDTPINKAPSKPQINPIIELPFIVLIVLPARIFRQMQLMYQVEYLTIKYN